jgi:hypothetical protein
MKITVDFDCTPEEARRLVGLPDLSSLHELYLEQMRRTLTEGVTPDMIEQTMRSWTPLGEAGMAFWRRVFEQATKVPSA